MMDQDRIGVGRDGERFGKQSKPLLDPALAMLERPSGVGVRSAPKRAADTPLHTVVESIGT